MSAPGGRDRSQALDILRLTAICLVLCRHIEPCPSEQSAIMHTITSVLECGGWIGVDLFFVLSGFLVSGILFKEYQTYRAIDFPRFFVRRGLRIYPMFLLLIVVTLGKEWFRQAEFRGREALAEVLFLQSYFQGLWSHTWSLGVEEHFYLVLPLLFLALIAKARRNRSREIPNPFAHLPMICLAVAGACLAIRITNGALFAYSHKIHLHPSHIRLDSLFFGVLLSYWAHFMPQLFQEFGGKYRRSLILVGTLCLVPAFVWDLPHTSAIYTVGLSLFYLGSGMILVGAVSGTASTHSFVKGCAFFGSHSYAIYLWHGPVLVWGTEAFVRAAGGRDNWWVAACVYWVGSFLIGTGVSLLLEKPCLALRDRYFASRSQILEHPGHR